MESSRAIIVGAGPAPSGGCSCSFDAAPALGIRSRIWRHRVVSSRIRVVASSGVIAGPSDSAKEEEGDMPGFIQRMEQTWLISKQPRPVACSRCQACGKRECPWCKGTGFFILGDNVLCEISSHNTSCYICAGKGVVNCDQCKGTGYRAKWLGQA
ncbi:uncharacterized protein LOC9658332 [Selaginella moellendorffii]|nr:uncharacterized protein LOC9658332 [Selaginella moellendorffii]|eukprot:XP_002981137.2 uncharacterized protein LOC9658332 [Selaginella moellendorffii]